MERRHIEDVHDDPAARPQGGSRRLRQAERGLEVQGHHVPERRPVDLLEWTSLEGGGVDLILGAATLIKAVGKQNLYSVETNLGPQKVLAATPDAAMVL